jgi:dynein heavy chain, axonemal
LFLSAEPSNVIPISILQCSIKCTNEPPEGLKANLKKALMTFSDDFFESCSKPAELKVIVFALSFFHAILLQRKKFGPQGFNMTYPFNIGDLTSCAQVTINYLENNPKVPWDDLRYIFGEIMYGGHIVDDWDRRLCMTYLRTYMQEELLEGFELYPGFAAPTSGSNLKGLVEYIETTMPAESPIAFGLHPNAEINFRLQQADTLFRNIQELQPKSAAGGGGLSLQDKASQVLDDINEKLPEMFVMSEITERIEERTPYTNVFLQEIERMNMLLKEIRRSLAELELGLKGDLQISDSMEALMRALVDVSSRCADAPVRQSRPRVVGEAGVPVDAAAQQLAAEPHRAREAAAGMDGRLGAAQGHVAAGAVQRAVVPHGRHADDSPKERVAA